MTPLNFKWQEYETTHVTPSDTEDDTSHCRFDLLTRLWSVKCRKLVIISYSLLVVVFSLHVIYSFPYLSFILLSCRSYIHSPICFIIHIYSFTHYPLYLFICSEWMMDTWTEWNFYRAPAWSVKAEHTTSSHYSCFSLNKNYYIRWFLKVMRVELTRLNKGKYHSP